MKLTFVRPVCFLCPMQMCVLSVFSAKYPTNEQICYGFLDMSTDLSVDARTFACVTVFTKRSAHSQ